MKNWVAEGVASEVNDFIQDGGPISEATGSLLGIYDLKAGFTQILRRRRRCFLTLSCPFSTNHSCFHLSANSAYLTHIDMGIFASPLMYLHYAKV